MRIPPRSLWGAAATVLSVAAILLLALNVVATYNTYTAGQLGEAASAATFMFVLNAGLVGLAIQCLHKMRDS